jgi:DNA-binding CsgD family transcriptional regulator
MNDKDLETITVPELSAGYQNLESEYRCIVCGRVFTKEEVYPHNSKFLLAEAAMRQHIQEEHGGSFSHLLGLCRGAGAVTETQSQILELMYEGLEDKQIAARLGGKTASAVRNHRYQMKKRKNEALLLLALLDQLEHKPNQAPADDFISFHAKLTVEDDRVIITQKEAQAILEKYLEPWENSFRMPRFPKKQKEKLVLLNRIVEEFEYGKKYREPELDAVLRLIHSDYVTLRRYFIEYGFMAREKDGSFYWRLQP